MKKIEYTYADFINYNCFRNRQIVFDRPLTQEKIQIKVVL